MIIPAFVGPYNFLSNFTSSIFVVDGVKYKTVEHYYQANKTKNVEMFTKIVECDGPVQAKRLGKKVMLKENWENIKEDVMLTALRKKFQIPKFRRKLLDTGNMDLIEGNYWHDNYWGSCTCRHCSNILGRNRLGYLIMKVRDEIRREIGM
jgi:ribA/ribD-fused uncharacterized protein